MTPPEKQTLDTFIANWATLPDQQSVYKALVDAVTAKPREPAVAEFLAAALAYAHKGVTPVRDEPFQLQFTRFQALWDRQV